MYILKITRGHPSEKYKGLGIFEFDQAKALVDMGHKVVIAAVDMRSMRRWRKWGIGHLEKDGVLLYSINIPCGRIPDWLRTKISIAALKYLYSIIYKQHGLPQLIHAHFFNIGYLGVKLKEQTGLPLIVTEHSSTMLDKNATKYKLAKAEKTYDTADYVVAVSSYLQDVLYNRFKVNATRIPNLYSTNLFCYKKRKPGSGFNFVSVGNLVPSKRMDLLIEAFYRAFNGLLGIKLYIFGDGPERKKLAEIINRYKLNKQIFLMGHCTREVIAEKYANSDCFVLASEHETFGVACIEALACGVPVIVTDCGGPRDYVNENNGIIVTKDNASAIAEALEYMYHNVEGYNRKAIADGIKNEYSPGKIAEKLSDLYLRAVKGN